MKNYEHIVKQANDKMDQADWLFGIVVIFALIFIYPNYCTAALMKEHMPVKQVPVLQPVSARVLMNAMTPLHGVKLKPLTLRVPAPLPRKHR